MFWEIRWMFWEGLVDVLGKDLVDVLGDLVDVLGKDLVDVLGNSILLCLFA